MQAPAPARIVDAGIPTEALITYVLVSKYADHLPLYRQAQIYARQGVDLDRSTLADWVGRAAWYLRPLHERLPANQKASGKLFAEPAGPAKLRNDGAGARPRTGRHEDRPTLGLRPR